MSYWAIIGQQFAKILLGLFIICGIFWVLDKLFFAKQRLAAGVDKKPIWLEFTADLFPIIAFIFILRSFFFEPFKIPSGSMIPTLQIGDFILVNKFTYGVRFPVWNKKIIEVGSPVRGDVVVFRYPVDETVDYIKRVVGVPGDVVEYKNKHLTVNGKPFTYENIMFIPQVGYDERSDFIKNMTPQNLRPMHLKESFPSELGGGTHMIENDPQRPSGFPSNFVPDHVFPDMANCQYSFDGFVCKVPPGNYFMMGDNRDNSLDSRYWGFVPETNLVGKAFFIWMNFSDLKRIGTFH
jgi:signal peptidase I